MVAAGAYGAFELLVIAIWFSNFGFAMEKF
jgi:hypothetical protein